MEEKRIYSVSPALIVPNEDKRVIQPYGRQSAQHAHAVGKVWYEIARRAIANVDYEPTTTILLQCRDSKELAHVLILLVRARIAHERFYDRNPEYGPGEVFTSLATHPIEHRKVMGILDYLPLLGGPTI